ncbi:MAG: glycosyltransferase family 4 protein [Thermoplasmata archaeon]|nr:glycosyltransferase family 4 protein [Thermoplasmata archaeon]
MKIAYISKYSYPHKTGGAEISNKLLLEHLKNLHVIEIYENNKYDHIYPYSIRKLYSYYNILKQLRREKIDLIVITQTNWCSFHGVFLAKILNAKLIINECGDYWRQTKTYKKYVGKYTLRFCDGITTRTEFLKNYILQFHPESEEKIRVIPNSIDPTEYSYKPYNRDTYIFSFFGRLTTAKDPFKILEIAKEMKNLGLNFLYQFHLYGEGKMERDFKKSIKENELDDIVKLKGVIHHTKIKEVISNSYLVLMPSTWEPQGRVILEAYACGRPVLTSGVGGMIEALGENNPLICYSNASLYTKNILKLVNDKKYYREICLSNLGKSHDYDIRKNAKLFASYFREVANDRR